MIITKLFEIRDRATFIPVVAVKMQSYLDHRAWAGYIENEREAYLLMRAGYSEVGHALILITRADGGGKANYDAYDWCDGSRTFKIAHAYIEKNFDALESGAVIDVEFILGESKEEKLSERLCP